MNKFGIAILNKNDPYNFLLKRVVRNFGIKNIIFFGSSKKCDVRLIDFKYSGKNSCRVFLEVLGKKIDFHLNNLGDHWIENSLAITSVIVALNKNVNFCIRNISKFNALKGRGKILNIKYKKKKITLMHH